MSDDQSTGIKLIDSPRATVKEAKISGYEIGISATRSPDSTFSKTQISAATAKSDPTYWPKIAAFVSQTVSAVLAGIILYFLIPN